MCDEYQPARAEADLERVEEALRRGDLFLAFDLAIGASDRHPAMLAVKHRALLALARCRATRRALDLFRQWRPDETLAPDDVWASEFASLRARLLKDRAAEESGATQRVAFKEAAEAYLDVFDRFGSHYAGTNAATLFLWAGDVRRAREIARRANRSIQGEDYWALASRAECALVCESFEVASQAIEIAALAPADEASRASTRRQLARSCDILSIDRQLLEPLSPKAVIRYVGHLPNRLDSEREEELS